LDGVNYGISSLFDMKRAERRRIDRPAIKWMRKQKALRPTVPVELLAEEFALKVDLAYKVKK
jgi:hypothetical protein